MAPSATQTTLHELIAARTRAQGHRPLLTSYDDRAGGRTELSYATADNWAAKTAHLLHDELAVRPGGSVVVDVDGHWTAAVIALACWKLGAAVAPSADGARAGVICCHDVRLDEHPGGPLLVVGDGLRAEPLAPLPGRDDLVVLGDDVHAFADDYDDPQVGPDAPAVATAAGTRDHADVLRAAAAAGLGLGDGARVALAGRLDTIVGIELLAAVLVASGSLVTTRGPDDSAPWSRWQDERVTVALVPGDAVGGAPADIRAIADGGLGAAQP